MAVIELGLVTDGEAPAARDPGPLLARGTARRLLAAGIAVFCLLAVTASEVPRPPGVATLWSLELDGADYNYVTSRDTLYFLHTAEDPTLTAYDLRTGDIRWHTATTGDWIWPLSPAADVLLLPSTPHDTDAPYSGADIVAVDAGTGRQLWQQHGDLLEASAELVLLLTWDGGIANEGIGDGADGGGELRAVRLRDGGTAWSRTAPAAPGWTQVLANPGTDRIVTITDGGRIDGYAFTDGRATAGATVPWTSRPEDSSSLRLVADTLLVQRDVREQQSLVTAYDAGTLRTRWQLTLPAYSGLTDCGDLLCVYAGDSLSGYDRATGSLLWRIAGNVTAAPLDTGRLLIEDAAAVQHRLLDAGTGRIVADLGEARAVQDPRTGAVTPWFLAATHDPEGLTAVSELDERAGRLVLRGAIERLHDVGCLAEHDVLVCPTAAGRLIVVATGPDSR